jgi:hypothetical protein
VVSTEQAESATSQRVTRQPQRNCIGNHDLVAILHGPFNVSPLRLEALPSVS